MDSDESKVGKLTEESLKRRERLRLLREKVARKDDKSNSSTTESEPLPK